MNLSRVFIQVLLLSLMGSILSLGILAIKAIFRRKLSARLHYYIWFVLILRLVLPLDFQSHLSLMNLFPTEQKKLETSFIVEQGTANIAKIVPADISKAADTPSNTIVIPEIKSSLFNYSTAALIWLSGLSIALLFILGLNILISIRMKKCRKCDNEKVISILETEKARLKINSKIDIVYDCHFKTPGAYGLIHPRILISEELINKLSPEELRYIIIHELTHIRKKDLLVNTFIMYIQAIYWFNPLIWYSLHQIRQDCEIACDETVLTALKNEEIKEYGQTMINMLSLLAEQRWVYGTLGFANKYSKRRIIEITRFKKNSAVYAILSIFLIIIIGCSSTVKPAAAGVLQNNNAKSFNNATSGTEDKPSEDNSARTPSVHDEQNILLADIMKLAQQGKIINSEFAIKTTIIDDIEKKLGQPDKVDWVPSAKGNYAVFSKYNVVYGFNKGEQIFEVRSFDDRLNKITLSKVKEAYGAPPYDVKSNGGEILGYTAGTEYKILFVFPEAPNGGNDRILSHYSVLYPKGTVNLMADDPGRQW